MKTSEIISPKVNHVYCDLDGCVVDLVKGLAHLCNCSVAKVERNTSQYWEHVQKTMNCKDVFSNLEFETNAKNLLKFFDDRNIPYTFLTCPAGEPNTEDSIAGKKEWLNNSGLGHIPVIFEKYKEKYATSQGKPNLLIDDRNRNIREWSEAGGIAIKYKNSDFSSCLVKLEELFGTE